MTRSLRHPLPLALAGALCALATTAPAALAAKAQHGVVLSAGHGTVRLIDSHHRVSDAHVRSARGLKRGAVVSISHGSAQVTGHARTVAFFGRVVRSSAHGAVLRLADGSTFKLQTGGGQRGARLARGRTVLVTLAAGGRGNVAKSVKPVGAGRSSSDGGQAGDQGGGDEIDGVVTDIASDDSSIGLDPGDGSDAVEIPVPDASLLGGVNVGDQVAVTTDDAGNATEIDVLDSASSDDGSDGSSSGGGQQSGDGSGDGSQQTGDAPDDGSDG
jgi:hypothetical protein